jgi:hypothetical protein
MVRRKLVLASTRLEGEVVSEPSAASGKPRVRRDCRSDMFVTVMLLLGKVL